MNENVNVHDNYPDSNQSLNVPTMQVTPLKRICVTIGELPTAYIETMSYYEMLLWFIGYLRDNIIPAVNGNAEAVQEVQGVVMDLQQYINNFKDSIDQDMEDLETYVNNYFDNLDVQDEIDHKLDEMLANGELEQIIEQYIQSTAVWCFDVVNDMKQAENLINGSYARTLGFLTINDGGASLYKIRTKTNEETPNEMDLIAIGDDLVAELKNDKESVNPEQFGAYGDNTHDDATSLQRCIDYGTSYGYKIELLKKTYKVNSTIYLNNNNPNINGNNGTIKSDIVNAIISMRSGEILRECKIENLKIKGNDETATTNVGMFVCALHSLFKNITISNCAIGMQVDANNATGNLTGNHYENMQLRECNNTSMIIGADNNNKLTDGYINNCVFGGNVSQYHLSIGSCAGYKISNLHFWGSCLVALRTRTTGHTNIDNIYVEQYSSSAFSCHLGRDVNFSNLTINTTTSSSKVFYMAQMGNTTLKSVNINNVSVNVTDSELTGLLLIDGDNSSTSSVPVFVTNLHLNSPVAFEYVKSTLTKLVVTFNDFISVLNTSIDYTTYTTLREYCIALPKNCRVMIYGARYNNSFSDLPSMTEGVYTLTIIKGDNLGDTAFELMNHSANIHKLYRGYYENTQMNWFQVQQVS